MLFLCIMLYIHCTYIHHWRWPCWPKPKEVSIAFPLPHPAQTSWTSVSALRVSTYSEQSSCQNLRLTLANSDSLPLIEEVSDPCAHSGGGMVSISQFVRNKRTASTASTASNGTYLQRSTDYSVWLAKSKMHGQKEKGFPAQPHWSAMATTPRDRTAGAMQIARSQWPACGIRNCWEPTLS